MAGPLLFALAIGGRAWAGEPYDAPEELPQVTVRVAPVYPDSARRARIAGRVDLALLLSQTGEVISLHTMSGPGIFIQPAWAAARQWRFTRPVFDGKPIQVWVKVPFKFELESPAIESAHELRELLSDATEVRLQRLAAGRADRDSLAEGSTGLDGQRILESRTIDLPAARETWFGVLADSIVLAAPAGSGSDRRLWDMALAIRLPERTVIARFALADYSLQISDGERTWNARWESRSAQVLNAFMATYPSRLGRD